METPHKSRTGCLWGLIALQAFALLVTILIVMALTVTVAGNGGSDVDGARGQDEVPNLDEVWSCGTGTVKVVRIPLHGVIMFEEGAGLFGSSGGSTAAALRAIRRATHDAEVKAIIMDIDSGGGGVTASDIIYKALLDFKATSAERKVVAVFGDVAASGAYYVAMAADVIVAHPTSITGSIGVLMQSVNVRELAEKIGVKGITIKSSENKDLMNPLGELSPAQRQLLQEIVDDLYNRFVGIVSKGRCIPEEVLRPIADGKVFTATRALELKLVDQIGYWEDAVACTAKLLGEDAVKVYRYDQAFSLSALLRSAQGWNPVRQALDQSTGTRLQYRWEF